jgi:cell division protein FtsZ
MEDSTAQAVVPVAGNEELMAMSEFIRNLDVSFEIVSPAKGLILLCKSTTIKSDKRQEQNYFSFDLPVRKPQPIQKVEENAYAELTSEARDIKVNQPVEFVPLLK